MFINLMILGSIIWLCGLGFIVARGYARSWTASVLWCAGVWCHFMGGMCMTVGVVLFLTWR